MVSSVTAKRIALVVWCAWVWGCWSSSTGGGDSGGGDTGSSDARTMDSGGMDASTPVDGGLDARPSRCTSGADCTDPARPVCDVATGECVVCTGSDRGACASSERCESGRCVEINECDPNPCQNGGTCMDGAGTFTCTCPRGFMGMRCETNVDDCSARPCAHGTCTDGIDSYTCTCEDGWYGANCDTNCDMVAGPCVDVLTCAQADGRPITCAGCVAGRHGRDCSETCATPSGCTGTTTCAQADGAAISCEGCEAGRWGALCDASCTPIPTCTGAITCDRTTGNVTSCEGCVAGWSGALCDVGPRSCREILRSGVTADGTYFIDPDRDRSTPPVAVFCDMRNGGYTFFVGGMVENSPASILGSGVCPAGMSAFAPTTRRSLNALESFVTARGMAGTYYYANVFTGPAFCGAGRADRIGYLSDTGTWRDIGVASTDYSPLNISGNCNNSLFDPIPMDSSNGFVNRSVPTGLINASEGIETGLLICSVNERDRCGAVHFDGVDDLLIAPPSATYDAPGSFTLEAWIWVERTPSFYAQIAAHHVEAATAQGSYSLYLTSGGRLAAEGVVGSRYEGASSTVAVPLGRWVHVAGVFDSPTRTITVFIDGVPSGTRVTSFTTVNQRSGVPFTVGRLPDASSTHQPFPGYIDEVRFSTVVRYTAAFVPFESFVPDADTRILFHFDEGSGTTALDSASGITATLQYGASFASPSCP